MKDTIEMVIGKQDHLFCIGMNMTDGVNKVKEELSELMDNHQGSNFILLTDLFGGSVNMNVYECYKNHSNVKIITGFNLPLVLDLVLQSEVSEDVINNTIGLAREGMKVMENLDRMNADDE